MLEPAPPHAVPPGPLGVRWIASEVPELRAGVVASATIELENAGTVAWNQRADAGTVYLSHHWLDPLGNAIVWEGHRTPMPTVHPGERVSVQATVRGAVPPGTYRLAFDLVDEGRCWFAEVGNAPLALSTHVAPRLLERRLGVQIEPGPPELVEATREALAAQDVAIVEAGLATAYLAPGCRPAPDWARRILDTHEEGYAMVGGSIGVAGRLPSRRSLRADLRPWAPGFGRAPSWRLPLLCPSLTADLVPGAPWIEAFHGLPAVDPSKVAEPWLCDGRIAVSLAR